MNKKQKVSINNCSPALESSVDICWADGMIGAIPVFETYEDAEKYADGRQIVEITLE